MADKKETTQVNFRIEKELLDWIDAHSKKSYSDRTTLIKRSIHELKIRVEKEELFTQKQLIIDKKRIKIVNDEIKKLGPIKQLNKKEKENLFDLSEEKEILEEAIMQRETDEHSREYWANEIKELEEDRRKRRDKFISS